MYISHHTNSTEKNKNVIRFPLKSSNIQTSLPMAAADLLPQCLPPTVISFHSSSHYCAHLSVLQASSGREHTFTGDSHTEIHNYTSS